MNSDYLNVNLKWQLKSFHRPDLVQISHELYLSVSGRKDDLIQRILRHIETIIRNQDERAYDAFIKKCPISMKGFEYEKLVFEVLHKCPCVKSLSCSVHGSTVATPSIAQVPVQAKPNDEPLFTQPVNPEEQVLKALALVKQYQHYPELLDRIHRSIEYWRSQITARNESRENTNHSNSNSTVANLNLAKSPQAYATTTLSSFSCSSEPVEPKFQTHFLFQIDSLFIFPNTHSLLGTTIFMRPRKLHPCPRELQNGK